MGLYDHRTGSSSVIAMQGQQTILEIAWWEYWVLAHSISIPWSFWCSFLYCRGWKDRSYISQFLLQLGFWMQNRFYQLDALAWFSKAGVKCRPFLCIFSCFLQASKVSGVQNFSLLVVLCLFSSFLDVGKQLKLRYWPEFMFHCPVIISVWD